MFSPGRVLFSPSDQFYMITFFYIFLDYIMQCFVCVVVMHFGIDFRDSRLIGLGEPVGMAAEEGQEIESNFIINTTTIELQESSSNWILDQKRAASAMKNSFQMMKKGKEGEMKKKRNDEEKREWMSSGLIYDKFLCALPMLLSLSLRSSDVRERPKRPNKKKFSYKKNAHIYIYKFFIPISFSCKGKRKEISLQQQSRLEEPRIMLEYSRVARVSDVFPLNFFSSLQSQRIFLPLLKRANEITTTSPWKIFGLRNVDCQVVDTM